MSSVQPAVDATASSETEVHVTAEWGDGSSQFAPPASGAGSYAPMEANPFARPISAAEQTAYARPTEEASAGETVQRRRASRMERYRDVDKGTDAEA